MKLILASQSTARRALLDAAGVLHVAETPGVDEEAVRDGLRAEGVDARGLADALAELKAMRLSLKHPDALVLGCDQTLVFDNDRMFDKPETQAEAAEQLSELKGTTHKLISAAVICEAGRPVWRNVDVAKLHIREFSDAFLEDYLAAEWPAIRNCVGGYRLEGLGVQLFSRIEGSHFAILGLPLLPLLDYLRTRGILEA